MNANISYTWGWELIKPTGILTILTTMKVTKQGRQTL